MYHSICIYAAKDATNGKTWMKDAVCFLCRDNASLELSTQTGDYVSTMGDRVIEYISSQEKTNTER